METLTVGSHYLFEVIMNHHNLEYIHDAKCLNPHQAQWALFFTHFNFIVTYRPSNNMKADALSRILTSESEPYAAETILPPAMIISPIQWEIDVHKQTTNTFSDGRF